MRIRPRRHRDKKRQRPRHRFARMFVRSLPSESGIHVIGGVCTVILVGMIDDEAGDSAKSSLNGQSLDTL